MKQKVNIKPLSKDYLVTRGEGDDQERLIVTYKATGEFEILRLRLLGNSDLEEVAKEYIIMLNS